MHPAPSVIVFSVLSGAGFGLLAFLALGLPIVLGTDALLLWGAGYALAVTGLVASTFHLGNPRRALKAYTQWRTSWLSREAWAATGTLVLLAPVALAAVFGVPMPAHFGIVGTVLALLTVFSTAQIYAQLATVPRWNHGSVPAIFLVFSLAGGAILAGAQIPAAVLTVLLAPLLVWSFRDGDTRFARRGETLQSATGLGPDPRVLAQAHTAPNYLMREMIFRVGRKHSRRLRIIAVLCAAVLPAAITLFVPPIPPVRVGAFLIHLMGAFAQRWLFFAEAEHVVGLYYGAR